jgi:hypothetical protein
MTVELPLVLLVHHHDRNRFDCIASAAIPIADLQAGPFTGTFLPGVRVHSAPVPLPVQGAVLHCHDLRVITVTVTIDDSLPPGPGNWLDLPKSAVPAWTALTLEERRQILAGRGPSLLINLIRHQTPSERAPAN